MCVFNLFLFLYFLFDPGVYRSLVDAGSPCYIYLSDHGEAPPGPPPACFYNTVIDVNAPVLGIAKTHTGNFVQGQTGATYTVTVSNAAAVGPTSGTVIVTETLPVGMTLVSMTGTGWTCPAAGVRCTRSDVLAAG